MLAEVVAAGVDVVGGSVIVPSFMALLLVLLGDSFSVDVAMALVVSVLKLPEVWDECVDPDAVFILEDIPDTLVVAAVGSCVESPVVLDCFAEVENWPSGGIVVPVVSTCGTEGASVVSPWDVVVVADCDDALEGKRWDDAMVVPDTSP